MMKRINKDGSISYRERVYIEGRAINSPPFRRKYDAKAWKARKLHERTQIQIHGKTKLYEKITFQEFCVRWLDACKVKGLSPRTMVGYELYVKRDLVPLFGKEELKDLNEVHCHDLIKSLQKIGLTNKGINMRITVLKSILNEAIRQTYLLRNPIAGFKELKLPLAQFRFWTVTEAEQFLEANRNSLHYQIYIIALNTGMRLGEIAGLKWDRVDLNQKLISITRTRNELGLHETTKTNRKREIPMNDALFACLSRMEKSLCGHVFTIKGVPFDYKHVYRSFRSDQVSAGIENTIRFHDLRHTFASNFVMNGGNVFDLQKILGHTNIEMTMKYAHYSKDHLSKAMRIVSFQPTSDKVIRMDRFQA